MSGYVSQLCGQLLLCNVCKICTCLLSSKLLVDLQTMVMIMAAICLFFCFDDLDSITIKHFIPKQFVFDPAEIVMGIGMKVFGKADTDWVMLTLRTDDECPEFCRVRLLLVYIHLTKIQGEVLFPSKLELLNPPSDFVFVTQTSYVVLQDCMTLLVTDVLEQSGLSAKVGLHLLQKTGYLFGIWGDADVATLAKSARHKCIDIANTYVWHTAHLKTVSHLQHNNLNHVKKWKPVLLMSPTSAAMLNTESMPIAFSVVE